MSAPEAVLFDLDGTLLDTEPLWLEAEQATMAALGGPPWTEADQEHCLGGPLERVVAYMIGRSGGEHDHDEVSALLLDEISARFLATPLAWQPGARELLVRARDLELPTALVSASWRRLIDAVHGRMAEDLGADPFDVTVAGDEVAASKPDPAPYLLAAARLGAVPERCLAIEDSPTGVASALAAGCRVIGVPQIAELTHHPRLLQVRTLVGVDLGAGFGVDPGMDPGMDPGTPVA